MSKHILPILITFVGMSAGLFSAYVNFGSHCLSNQIYFSIGAAGFIANLILYIAFLFRG